MRERVSAELSQYPEAKVYFFSPSVIPGLGSSGGFEMVLEARGDATNADLARAVDTLRYYADACPEFSGLSSSRLSDIPQLFFDVDRDKAKLQGIPMSDIFSTMKAFTGSVYVNDFNMFNRIYRVYIQAEAPYRQGRQDLNLFFVRSADGTMVPISSLGTSRYTSGPGAVKRFNMFNSATISGEAASGYSTGQAMAKLEQIVREHLPENIGVEWAGLSYQQKHNSGNTAVVLGLAFLFVFLFLAALYESWTVPLAVMAKNAILIVEFAKEETDKGVDAVHAALTAARLRFRPLLMTSLAFMLGLLPLVFATGPGSAARRDIGTGVFFGMLVAVTVGIVFVPFFFVMIDKAKKKLSRK